VLAKCELPAHERFVDVPQDGPTIFIREMNSRWWNS